jgi:hypothetical protein
MRPTLTLLSLSILAGCGGASAVAPQSPTTASPVSSLAPAVSSTPASSTASTSASVGTAPTAAGGRVYTRADLDALERQKAWGELVAHLEDISPSQRDDRWTALATESVVEQLKSQRVALDKVGLAHLADVLAQRYPSIRTAPAFINIRGEIAVDAVADCSKEQAWEWEGCQALARLFEGDPKHAVAGAHAAGPGFPRFAMTLYQVALKSDAKTVCADDQALRIMSVGISTSPDQDFHQEAVAMQARCRAVKK